MQDAPRRACRTRHAGHAGRPAPGLQDAPHRACRTRRTGHAAHAGHTPGSASHMPCPNPSIRLHAHITSTRRRHCFTPSGMHNAPRLHASTPCSPATVSASHLSRSLRAPQPMFATHPRITRGSAPHTPPHTPRRAPLEAADAVRNCTRKERVKNLLIGPMPDIPVSIPVRRVLTRIRTC